MAVTRDKNIVFYKNQPQRLKPLLHAAAQSVMFPLQRHEFWTLVILFLTEVNLLTVERALKHTET
jgi:hypothetical protein